MKSAEALREAREKRTNPAARAVHGGYRRLLVAVRGGGAFPLMAVDYAHAWAAPDAVVEVAALTDAASPVDGATRGVAGSVGADVASAEAVRCALMSRGIEVSGSCLPRADAGAASPQSLGELAHRFGADIVLCDDRSAAHVARSAACNVLYLPSEESHRFHVPPRRIFVASDDSASARCALDEAARVAGDTAELRRAYIAFDADAGNSRDWASIALAAAHHGDNLAHAIVQAAREWGADLLVLGTHGRMPRAMWRYGSVAAAVAQVTDLPLLLVPEQS